MQKGIGSFWSVCNSGSHRQIIKLTFEMKKIKTNTTLRLREIRK
jgi:hypothetical protein